jgi:cytochrome c biogenesis protein CcmG/thiol:disulfide interchange protein DsbE
MRRYLRYLLPLFLFIGLVAFLLKGLDMNPRDIPSPLIGKPVPSFNLPMLKAPEQTITEEAFANRVVLLNVWATWCVSCRAEHRTLVQLARTGKVDIYGLNWKDDRVGALTWLRELGDPYVANAFDPVGRTAIDLGVYGAPETFVIDKKGIIRYKHAGPLSMPLLQEKILPLVAQLNAEQS